MNYSYQDERIRIRGTKVTPIVQAQLVHELTHALQDQRFDTGNRLEMLSRQPDPALAGGLRAVVEGDAQRTQDGLAEDPAPQAAPRRRPGLGRGDACDGEEDRGRSPRSCRR